MGSELELSPLRPYVRAWLAEDVGRGDVTTRTVIPAGTQAAARLEAREAFVLAGLGVTALCFELAGDAPPDWDAKVEDGQEVRAGDVIARVEGDLRTILTAERTALNVLARLSGIATLTARYAAAVAGTQAQVADTRKTTPGLRVLEKYAVRVGGGANHRFGLDDGILIKDNHIAAAGGIAPAVRAARAGAPHGLRVEVEVEDQEGLNEALSAGADAVLLDNMTVAEVSEAVAATGDRALLEVSGGISLEDVAEYAATGVDLVSVGALTHSARSVDVALEVDR
jgi:nicotinate-nucleotide pyrophosphorylase (carboxylating)